MGTGEALANWGMTPLGVKVLPWLSLKKERQKIGCGHLIVDHINGFGGWVQFEHQRKGGGEVRGLVYPGVHREVFYLLWGGIVQLQKTTGTPGKGLSRNAFKNFGASSLEMMTSSALPLYLVVNSALSSK